MSFVWDSCLTCINCKSSYDTITYHVGGKRYLNGSNFISWPSQLICTFQTSKIQQHTPPIFFTYALTNLLFSQRGYQTYKAKYSWGKKRFELGCDPPVLVAALVFVSTPLICSRVPSTEDFWNRSLPRNPTHSCNSIVVLRKVCSWSNKSGYVVFPGGPRHYDPGVYNQHREQLMAILPQSQQELPPRRCYKCLFWIMYFWRYKQRFQILPQSQQELPPRRCHICVLNYLLRFERS